MHSYTKKTLWRTTMCSGLVFVLNVTRAQVPGSWVGVSHPPIPSSTSWEPCNALLSTTWGSFRGVGSEIQGWENLTHRSLSNATRLTPDPCAKVTRWGTLMWWRTPMFGNVNASWARNLLSLTGLSLLRRTSRQASIADPSTSGRSSAVCLLLPFFYMQQWSRAVAPTTFRGGLVLVGSTAVYVECGLPPSTTSSSLLLSSLELSDAQSL